MVAQQATPRVPAEGRSQQQQQHFESITTCAFCGDDRNIYQMGDKWICIEHLASAVTLAACDVFSDCVSYTKSFEEYVL